jgi:hypothetical protein
VSGEGEEETMTTQATDTLFLMRAMRNQTELDFRGVDLDKWVAACLLSPERRARGMAYCETLMGQLPTAEDFERVPVEAEKPRHGTDLGQWLIEPDDLCPCESAMRFSDCHGLAPAE